MRTLSRTNGVSRRLATLKLAALTPKELANEIESEAREMFHLESASLLFDSESSSGVKDPYITSTGVAIPFEHGLLLGNCPPPLNDDWLHQAREFAAQMGALIEMHTSLLISKRRGAQLKALYETASKLAENLDVEVVLTTIIERARNLLDTSLAYITLVDADNKVVRMSVSVGHHTATFMEVALPIGAGIGGMVARSQQPAFSRDYLNDEILSHHSVTDDLVRLEGIRSILGVPLRSRARTVQGVLYVANRSPHDFTSEEVALLASLGDLAALALENARLYQEAVNSAAASVNDRALAERHLQELERVHGVHRGLTEVLLADEGIAGVARSLALALQANIVISDWRHVVLAHDGSIAEVIDERGNLSQRFLNNREIREALRVCTTDYSTVVAKERWSVAPIVARQEVMGFIWASMRLGAPMDVSVFKTCLEQAARVVALELLREQAEEETERRLRKDFMYDLLSDRPASQIVLRNRARQLGYQSDRPHRPVLFGISDTGEHREPFVERARELISEANSAGFVAIYGTHVMLFLAEANRDDLIDRVEQALDTLSSHGISATATICRLSKGLADDRATLMAAMRLQELLGGRRLIWLEGLEVLSMLFDSAQPGRLREFTQLALAGIAGQPALVQTLDAYYRAGGNRALAARKLNVHINTVRQRLQRIEELIGGSVDAPERAVPMRLALLALEATPVRID